MLQRVLILATTRQKTKKRKKKERNKLQKTIFFYCLAVTLSGLHPILSLLFLLLDFSSFTSLYFPSLGKIEVPSAKGSTKKI